MPELTELLNVALELTEGQGKNFKSGRKEIRIASMKCIGQYVGAVIYVYAFDFSRENDLLLFANNHMIYTSTQSPDADLAMVEGMLRAALVAVAN